jgi:1,4-alpha-glucan branching enzyme
LADIVISRKAWRADDGDVAAIIAARHADPFAVLGLHESSEGLALRAFVPGAWELRADRRSRTSP